jgi:naphtho-gamma-pyrone polyketide synthase
MDTACSSSFASIQTACSYLWRGECDTAIAGGANILTNPDNFAGLDRGWFLSHTGNCQAFDEAADGYCRADAVGTVMLKRLEDAEADGDPIFGVILGSNTNHCGNSESITRPFEDDQAAVFKQVMRRANVDPKDVSYIEMHGTGTQHGDSTEFASVLSVFDVPDQGRFPDHPLHLGTVKANIGHAESASGVVSLIKVLMMMQHDQIPPHVGIKTRLNPKIPADLAQRNVHIPLRMTPWERAQGGKRTVFLNNFSAAGGNTAILLQDAPKDRHLPSKTPSREPAIITVSGKTPKAFRSNADALAEALEKGIDAQLGALSYTTTARRMHHPYRAAFLVEDSDSLAVQLRNCSPIATPKTPAPVIFVFSGQGVMYQNLGGQLYERVQAFRDDIHQFNALAKELGASSFLPLICQDHDDESPLPDSPITTQLAICSIQMALARLLQSWGVEPFAVTGHSLGEYAALVTAGVLTPADAIYLVYKRAQLLVDRCTQHTHAMLVVKASLPEIRPFVDQHEVDTACLNAPDNSVLAGPLTTIQPLKSRLEQQGIRCMLLDLPYAFHSAQVDPILDAFEHVCTGVETNVLKTPYFSPLTGEVISKGSSDIKSAYFARACRGTVKFEEAVRSGFATLNLPSNALWVELGSHPICSRMLKGIVGPQAAVHLHTLERDVSPFTTLFQSVQSLYLSGANMEWNEFQKDVCSAADSCVLPLPRYGWDLSNYWIDYRNNFCLTKGNEPRLAKDAVPARDLRISSSVHEVLEQSSSAESASLIVQTNLLDSALTNVIDGHKVNGSLLCTSSLYADIALTASHYLLQQHGQESSILDLDSGSMVVAKPIIIDRALPQQYLQTKLSMDLNTKTVHCSFTTGNGKGQEAIDHAKCMVTLSDSSVSKSQWSRQTFLVKNAINTLRTSVETGSASRMKRGMVYKLFGALVDYSNHFQGMQEVLLDSDTVEGSAQVQFQVADDGFTFHPCWIDSLGSIAGFILNAREGRTQDFVYINHGWESMRRATEFSQGKVYTTYNRMHRQGSGETYVGDTYVLDGDETIAVFEGIRVSSSSAERNLGDAH